MISSIIQLPPEIQIIIQKHYKQLLRRQKYLNIKNQILKKLYFWMHLEGMYNIDYRSLRSMAFTMFRPRLTPVGIMYLPRAATILIPNTFLILI